jgi:hypothetical protein
MLFNFTLAPLAEVSPWGEPGDHHLHWFGLTYGLYWMEVGQDRLFEYSEQARAALDLIRYVDYYVVRLYEDILEMFPFVLEPVPASLIPYLSGETGQKWDATFTSWWESLDDDPNPKQYSRVVDLCIELTSNRFLDAGYLRQAPQIGMWSDESLVYIEWDNRERLFEGVPAWSARYGTYALPREQFISEVKSFHSRLMEQMAQRIDEVIAGALPPDVRIEQHGLPGLQEQHELRRSLGDKALAAPPSKTDWRAILAAVQEVERMQDEKR